MKAILTRLFNHEELTTEEARQLLLNISRGIYPEAQVAALLTVFQMRSITVDELAGFREALMETRIHINFAPYRPIDIVGTGGDGKNTFNISTCACFIVAGAGYKVAKHGNYGATSVSGASNVIEQHGIRFTNNPDTLKRSMEECNIAYLHAQLFNPAMKLVAPVRKALGVRTLFNLLGPLVNPCEPAYHPKVEFTSEAMDYLSRLPYPGNIRELKNLVERTLLVSGKEILTADDFKSQYQHPIEQKMTTNLQGMTLEEIEKQTILQTLEKYNNNMSQVAIALGISRAALYRRLEKYNIQVND